MQNFFIEPYGPVPAHAQIKDQIKFACLRQELKPGDALPSIRQLARQLSVGSGIVRRAYRELCEGRILSSEGRKHLVGKAALAAELDTGVVRGSAEQCERLIEWARVSQLSAIALARLLLRYALLREFTLASYFFVDICRLAAEKSAAHVARSWGIAVTGVSARDFATLWRNNARHISAVLVNECLYEDVIKATEEDASRVFSLRMRLDEPLRRRIGRLPMRSPVLLVCSDEDCPRTDRAIQYYKDLLGSRRPFRFKKASEIPDLTNLIRMRRYQLFLFNPLTWSTLPTRIKRFAGRVAPTSTEPDPLSLEETRLAAGVLL